MYDLTAVSPPPLTNYNTADPPHHGVDKYFLLGAADCISNESAADNKVSKRNILQLLSVRQSFCPLRSLQYPTRLVLSTLSSP